MAALAATPAGDADHASSAHWRSSRSPPPSDDDSSSNEGDAVKLGGGHRHCRRRTRRILKLACATSLSLLAAAAVLLAPAAIRSSAAGCRGSRFFASSRFRHELYTRHCTYYHGRDEGREPSPRCCQGAACLPAQNTPARNAVVTMLRTDQYLGLTQALACSLNRTNPGLPLLVLTVPGDLRPATEAAVHEIATLHHVDEFYFTNSILPRCLVFTGCGDIGSIQHAGEFRFYNTLLPRCRFGLNWIKLRGWELTDWDGLLMLDSDMMVEEDISWVFSLPTDFATVLDADRIPAKPTFSPMGQAQGGFVFFRPCAAVAQHMQQLAQQDPILQYRHSTAEQAFLDWYYKYTRLTLPLEFNGLTGARNTVIVAGRNVTRGGAQPVIRHYVGTHKPWRDNLRRCEAAVAAAAASNL